MTCAATWRNDSLIKTRLAISVLGWLTVSRPSRPVTSSRPLLTRVDAWDFISAVTFSKRFGYMEKGCDFDGTLHIADQAIDYLGIVGQMPFLDFCLDKNPIVRIGPPNLDNVARIAVEALFPRLKGEDKNFDPKNPDFLQYFIDSKTSHPEVVDDGTIINYLLLNCELIQTMEASSGMAAILICVFTCSSDRRC